MEGAEASPLQADLSSTSSAQNNKATTPILLNNIVQNTEEAAEEEDVTNTPKYKRMLAAYVKETMKALNPLDIREKELIFAKQVYYIRII